MNPLTILPSSIDMQLFQAMPGNSVLLLPDSTTFTIVAVTDEYTETSGHSKEQLIGKGLFEAFPNPPDDPEKKSEKGIRTSLEHALFKKERHRLALHRYDIPKGDGSFEERYWSTTNKPVLNESGEVLYIIHSAEDVTLQVKAEHSTKRIKSLEKPYSLFLQAPVSIGIIKGDEYMIEMANDRLLEVWGRTSEVVGKPLFKALPELNGQGFKELLDQVRQSGESFYAYEYPSRLIRDGKEVVVYFDFVYKPYYEDGQASPVGVFAVGHDVTKQVEARQKVEESVQEVRAIVESAPFPIGVYTGKEMRIRLVNKSIIDVWGKGPDVIGRTYSEVLPELQGSGIYKQLDSVYETGVPFHARNQRVDLVFEGKLQPFYFNYSFTPLYDVQGKVYGVMNTAAEITDLHHAKQQVEQSERNFRSMILQAPVAMCILLGPEHIVEVANDAIIELWGKPKEQVMNKPIFEALPDARNQGLESVMDEVYGTGTPFYANERPVDLLRNGKLETLYLNFVYQPYYDADGNIMGVLAIAVDVTSQVLARQKIEDTVVKRTSELAAANEALVKSNQELKRLNTNLEDFTYAASHDLKEPIRKVHFFSDRLRNQLEDNLTEEQKRFFERLENASKRMGSLVEDLLAYSHASRGLEEKEEVDLNKKVRLVLGDLELEVQQRSAIITVDRLPTIRGSKRQMQQFFQNLITNALKYSKPDTAPEIQICYRQVMGWEVDDRVAAGELEKSFHLIEVRDNGIGFQQEDAQRIFNVFTRLHANAEHRGSGVGLSIVQKVVQSHQGYVWAKSKPGEGATFKVLLPAES
jgi:PAS domain S-box-containing protein